VKATAAATDTVLLHGLITAFGAALEKQQPNAPTYDPKNPARAGSYFSVRISPIPAVPGIDKLPPKILSEGEVGLSDLSVVFVNEVEYAGLGARSLLDKRWEERTAEIEARNAELRVILRVLTTLAEARNRKLLSAAEVAEKSAKVRGAMNAITREAISLAEKTKPANSAGAPPSRVRMPVMGLPQALIDEAIELEKRLRPLVEKTGPTARLEPAVTLTSGCLDLAIVVMVPPTSPT
jgi:hypothetical protein